MSRTIVIAVIALAAALLSPPPVAHAKGDDFASARKAIFKQFKKEAKSAQKLLSDIIKARTKVLRGGDTASAVTDVGNAVAFFAESLKILASDASEDFTDEAVGEMTASGDNDQRGGVAGDGGSLDSFYDDLQKEVDKQRAKALKSVRKFASAVRSDGQPREGMRVMFNPWPITRSAAPTPTGAVTTGDEPIRLFGTITSRLSNGAVIVTAFGCADARHDGQIDLRMEGTPSQGAQESIGEFISGGGLTVTVNGTWSVTEQINDPFTRGVDTGNRVLKFGIEPVNDQPTRQLQAGVISIP